MTDEKKAIPIGSLSVDDLQSIKQRVEAEIEQLSTSLDTLGVAVEKFLDSKEALAAFVPQNKNKQVLIPLTTSLYVPAIMSDVDTVTVNVGANYFIRQSPRAAEKYFDRRVTTINGQRDQLKKVLQNKYMLYNAVLETLKSKSAASSS
ncbi:prefoldin, alpha subunit [Pelomyxa schiedti]|nr:prefoldin, alpha subunit [Pelomyxa schiedti]